MLRLTLLLFLIPLAASSALPEVSPQQEAVQQSVPAASQVREACCASGFTTHSWTVTIDELGDESPKTDEEFQKRLRVVWEKPNRKVDEDRHRSAKLEIAGKLSLLQADGKTLKPVDWPLPISVVLSMRPDVKPDWSRRHDRRDSLWSENLVGRELIIGVQVSPDGRSEPIPLPKKPDGTFTATFYFGEIHSVIGATKPFQVGLCLGEKKGKAVTWRNEAPILPQTVQMVEVPGPKPISRTLQLINACPTPIGWDFDPIALVRAANHLRWLGKEKSIEALREFLKLAYDTGYTRDRIDPENIDTSNQWCLATLVPVVFDDVGARDDITVCQGIPFHTVVINGTSGWPGSTRRLVDAAAQRGKLIQKPFRPADNPLEAADALFEKIGKSKDRDEGGFSNGLHEHLREQAWRAVRHLVDPVRKQSPDLRYKATWDKLKANAAQLKIRWDEEKQEYVAGGRLK
jgi:hypothetical protein